MEKANEIVHSALTRSVSYVNAFVYNFNSIENFWPTNKMELMGVGAVAQYIVHTNMCAHCTIVFIV